MHKGPAAFVRILAGAPMTTPPAKEAFKMSSRSNLCLKKEVMIKVPKQLPVREIIVFAMIVLFSYGFVAKYPALNDGQNIHRKNVPKKAKTFEL